MGLSCSKQGYIQDFHELQESRLGPEGESFPIDYLKTKDKNQAADLTTQQLQQQLTVLLQDEKLAKRLSASLCLSGISNCQERVLYGKDEKSLPKDILVDLPPEGKVCNEQDFVELPPSDIHKNKLKIINGPVLDESTVVHLPPEESVNKGDFVKNENNRTKGETSSIAARCDVTCVTDNDVIEIQLNQSEEEDEDQWMYKWYDFHENGIVSKQDVNRLMDSICNVVTNSLTSDHQKHNNMQSRDRKCSSRDRKSSLTAPNNLKVHLEISQRRRRKSANQNEQYVHTREPLYDVDKIQTKRKAYNKYCAARKYNDLIFPPPNSEEAEKVSTYIEEKILKHRRFNVSSDAKPSRTSYRDIKQNSKKTTCSRCTKSHDLNEHSRRKHHHHHISESDTHTHPPRRRSEREKRYHNAGVLVTTQPLVHVPATRDSTACHRVVKRDGSCDISASDPSLSPSSISGSETPFSCDEVFTQHRCSEKESSDSNSNESSLRFNHSCSCNRKLKLQCCENIYHARRCHRKSDSALPTTTSTTNTKERCSKVRQEPTSPYSRGLTTHGECSTHHEGRNEHRKKFRRPAVEVDSVSKTPEISRSSTRPEVWPGKAASVVNVPAVTNPVNMEELCFCKRMLGLDHPCNH